MGKQALEYDHWYETGSDLEIFKTLQQGDSPLVILGSGLFNQRDFVIDFVRNRLLVKVAMDEVDESRQASGHLE